MSAAQLRVQKGESFPPFFLLPDQPLPPDLFVLPHESSLRRQSRMRIVHIVHTYFTPLLAFAFALPDDQT
jgi:hypothetical protein